MTDTNHLIDTIRIIPHDSTLYLLEKLPCETGLFAFNGNVLYLVPNTEKCTSLSIQTEYLRVETNVFVSAFNPSVSSFENGYYNYVELQLSALNDLEVNLSAFLNLCLAHATYTQGEEFMPFFDTLVSLFQLPREQQYKNLVGLMGELLLIEYLYNNFNQDISFYWHTNGSLSRLDFVCPFANFEVKATASGSLNYAIKHDQLFVNADKNYLIAVVMEENNAGRTLEELINTLLVSPDYCNGLEFTINIEREKRRISPIELRNKRFVLKKICAYRATDINPFDNIPDCVEALSYRLNLVSFPSVSFTDILPISYD